MESETLAFIVLFHSCYFFFCFPHLPNKDFNSTLSFGSVWGMCSSYSAFLPTSTGGGRENSFFVFFFQKGTNRSTLKEIKQINIIVRKKSMVAAKLSCSAKVKLKQLLPKKENIRCKSKRDMCRFSVQRWMPCFCVTKQMLMLLKPWSCSIFTEKINNRQFFLKGQIMRSSCSN